MIVYTKFVFYSGGNTKHPILHPISLIVVYFLEITYVKVNAKNPFLQFVLSIYVIWASQMSKNVKLGLFERDRSPPSGQKLAELITLWPESPRINPPPPEEHFYKIQKMIFLLQKHVI
jgi:hypothetical protein